MAQTGGAAVVSGALGVAATKILAATLGPAQIALFATLQQLRTTAVTCGSLAGQTALVQGAASQSGRERREYLRTVACLMAMAVCIAAACLLMFPAWIAAKVGLAEAQSPLIAGLGVAAVLGAIYIFLSGVLNATGAIGRLALVQLSAPAAMAILAPFAVLGVRHGHESSFVILLAASTAIAIGFALWALKKERAFDWLTGEDAWWNHGAARRFFAISGSMFASALFSSWVLTVTRARILQREGFAVGGQFDAAWTISMNQAGLLLASLQTYYLPAISKMANPEDRSALIGRALAIAALTAAGLISALIVLKPLVIAALYSQAFAGSAHYLRWTLAGDYLKVTSWILSIPLVASASMRTFLAADVAAYGTFAAVAFGLQDLMGAAEAASIAFVAMYAMHLAFCGSCLWLRKEFRPDLRLAVVWLAGFATVAVVSALCWGHA